MADQYTIELAFNRPPEDIRRMAVNAREASNAIPRYFLKKNQQRNDLLYMADLMDEIANKMEE